MSDPITRLNAALEGRYRIERELGEGGMATVYLADDLRHERKVALKVLKPELAAVVGAERFLAEIKTTANLQHPHILPLHDSGEADGFLYFVMPYVEGETLRVRLEREKQLPIDEAIGLIAAVGSALDYAHRHDVIHRDIKPANILLHDGQPVVADFGIALAVHEAGGGRLTETGLSLGTPYYMSPEQATADRDPSAASDVYSLGCVLYEVLTGEPPFTGNTAQAVLGRILTGEAIPPREHRKSIPEHVEAIVLKSLEKLPADRFTSASDFVEALKDPSRVVSARRPTPKATAGARALPWLISVASVTALVVSLQARDRAPLVSRGEVVATWLELPDNMSIEPPIVAISEDGSRLAITGLEDGTKRVLVHEMSELDFRGLPGSDGAERPSLSPDGSQIYLRLGGQHRALSAEGGTATVVDGVGDWGGGHEAPDGYLYYSRSYLSGVWRIPVAGGEPEMLTEPNETELSHWWPRLLPDGEHVMFTAFRTPIDSASIDVVEISTGTRTEIVRGAVFGRYLESGHLVYARDNTIFGVAFDLESLTRDGRAVQLIQDVAQVHPDGYAAFDMSSGGTAVYVRASEYEAPTDLVWVDREGRQTLIRQAPDESYSDPALSPDGTRLALTVSRSGGNSDVFVLDRGFTTLRPLTTGGGADFGPVWSPDGLTVVYIAETPVFDLFQRPADGGAPPSPFYQDGFDKYPWSFAPDGRTLLAYKSTPPDWSLIAVDRDAATEGVVRVPAGGDLRQPAVSPDGRTLAFVSDESGGNQVYVVTYPELTDRRRVSTAGGLEPRWTRGGQELIYRNSTTLLSVTVQDDGDVGEPVELFTLPMVSPNNTDRSYDVSADGERFVTSLRPPERTPRRMHVITNFLAHVERLVGPGG